MAVLTDLTKNSPALSRHAAPWCQQRRWGTNQIRSDSSRCFRLLWIVPATGNHMARFICPEESAITPGSVVVKSEFSAVAKA